MILDDMNVLTDGASLMYSGSFSLKNMSGKRCNFL